MLVKGKNENSILQNPSLKAWERQRGKQLGTLVILFLGMLAFKIAAELGYVWLNTQDAASFPVRFSLAKYTFGWICCLVLFFAIRHESGRASSFFLYFMYLFQIIPITTAYAFGNRSTGFYGVLCLGYLLCCLVVGFSKGTQKVQRNNLISKTVAAGYGAVMVLIVAVIMLRYGMPSLKALNLFNVYELRGSGAFKLGQYENYLFTWSTAVILPAGIAWCITKRQYLGVLALSGIMLMLYLYSGHKTFLFSIPLVIVCTFWSRRPGFYKELFTVGCFGFLLLVILLWVSPVAKDLIQRVFSLLGRRVLYIPANNKFHYYEYFSTNPKMGLGGIFPRWLLYIPNHYENIPYTYEISEIFYGKPEMNSNTGFLAEGYMRFGHIGTLGILLVFAWILKLIDGFQDRMGYQLAVGLFVYQIYSLADAHLLDSLVLGPWMLLLGILLLCGRNASQMPSPKHWHLRRVQLNRR